MSRVAAALRLAAALALGACLPASAEDAAAPAYPAGAATFKDNCAVCHGPAGAGIPALAPPLTANPARYAANAEGRRQLALTVLYGMFGDIVVEDKHYNFQMPEFSRFDDASLAATLNFVVFDLDHAGAEVKPLTAADLAAERAHPLDATAVREHRKSVAPSNP
jgi:mono/diheme cytochrome c family protein